MHKGNMTDKDKAKNGKKQQQNIESKKNRPGRISACGRWELTWIVALLRPHSVIQDKAIEQACVQTKIRL